MIKTSRGDNIMKTNLRKAIVVIPFAMTMIVPSVTPILANDGTEPQVVQETNQNYEYHVAFNANGLQAENMPDSMDGLTTGTIALPEEVPTADGYTFIGWSTDADAGSESSEATIYQASQYIAAPEGQTTFYAIWQANDTPTPASDTSVSTFKYTITYNNSGVDATGMPSTQSGQTDENTNMVSLSGKTPKAEGYTFLGWGLDPDHNAVYQPGATLGLVDDLNLNLYAIWQKDTDKLDTYKYTITYHSSGIAASGMPETQSGQTDENTNMVSLSDKTPTAAGYKFLGWGPDPDHNAVYQPGYTLGLKSDLNLDLYAIWQKETPKQQATEINYNIYFNSNIKVEKGMPERMSGVLQENQGNKVTLPTTTPIATGYTFVGWTTDKNGTKVEYKAGDAVEFKTGTSEVQNVQLYALWQKADGTSKASTVQTGTETNIGLYAGVTGVAAALLAAIGLKKKFRK